MHDKNKKPNAKIDNTSDINAIGKDPLPPKAVDVSEMVTNHLSQSDSNFSNAYSSNNNIAHIMNVKRQQRIWLLGGIVSLLPVLVIGIFQFIRDVSLVSLLNILSNTSDSFCYQRSGFFLK